MASPLPALVRQVNAGSTLVYGGGGVPDRSESRLPAGSSAVRFQFAAPVYSDSGDVEYQYLLEGADKDWSAWGKQKEANYSGLGPGNYRFRVHARGDDGRVSPEGSYAFVDPAAVVPHHAGLGPLCSSVDRPRRYRLALDQPV